MEQPISVIEQPNIEIKQEFASFVPQAFLDDPFGYFEREGINIKKGQIKYDEQGAIREDPTAVKDLPAWGDAEGNSIRTVGKRVNVAKGVTGKSGEPFHEYAVLETLAKMNLPAARPIAKIEQGGKYLIVTERIPGMRWAEKDSLNLKEQGYNDQDIAALMIDAETKMREMEADFLTKGIRRSWKLQDMVFQIDIPEKKILALVPTDWERTEIVGGN